MPDREASASRIAALNAQQVQLNLVSPGAGQTEGVERIAVRRNRGHVRAHRACTGSASSRELLHKDESLAGRVEGRYGFDGESRRDGGSYAGDD